MQSAGRQQVHGDISEREEILAEVHRRITEQRNGHFHRSADGYSDPDNVVNRAKSAV